MRIALFGDIHGNYTRFYNELLKLGLDEISSNLPLDLMVIQVGDLVHGNAKGQDDCLILADKLLANNPSNYIQLWGNHDVHYLGGPDVSGRSAFSQVSPSGIGILRRWYGSNAVKLSYALNTKELGDTLITHGGLTKGLWQELGSPKTADEAALLLNNLLAEPAVAFRPGWLMTGVYDLSAGVTGPRTGAELARSWIDSKKTMPFNQIHGHKGVWWWPGNCYHDDVDNDVIAQTQILHEQRQSIVKIKDKVLWSIDGRLEMLSPSDSWQPLMLNTSCP